ncbi:MAG: hypothetical protein Kow0020_15360 [Wenzhouxiangellaceae bacterium]
MTSPPKLVDHAATLAVWLISALLAVLAIAVPIQRLLVAAWVPPQLEWIDDEGSIVITGAGSTPPDEARLRSRPHSIVIVERHGRPEQRGYLVGRDEAAAAAIPEAAAWWEPARDLALGVADPEYPERVTWLEDAGIRRVIWPNRMHWTDRLRLSAIRVIEHRFEHP